MNWLQRLLEDPVRVARVKRWSFITVLVIAVGEFALPRLFPSDHGAHDPFGFESVPAWGSLYGLISCVAIIVLSKLIGVAWLMKREDFYDD